MYFNNGCFVDQNGLIVVPITYAMNERAKIKAKQMGRLRNSIRKGEGNITGFMGEEAVLKALDGSVEDNTFEHDVLWEGLTIETKTKDRTVPPQLRYAASVANFNAKQDADLYFFVSLRRRGTTIADLKTASMVIGGTADAFETSVAGLAQVLHDLDEPSHSFLKHLIRRSGLRFDCSPQQHLVDVIRLVLSSMKKLDNQMQTLERFGINPLLINTFTEAYIMGCMSPGDYKAAATFLHEGDYDPDNDYTVKADCYNLVYSKLQRFAELNDPIAA